VISSFPRHEIRQVRSLDGLWDFAFLGDVTPESIDIALVTTDDKIPLPAAWDALPAYAGKRGLAVYRRVVTVTPGKQLVLKFGAVSLWCRVLVDRVAIRDHACGYTGFACVVPASEQAKREIVLLVDNRFDFARVPLHEHFFDFHQWGGIIRDVTLHQVGESFLQSAQVTTTNLATGEIAVAVRFDGAPAGDLRAQIDEGPEQRFPATSEMTLRLNVPDPTPWSPESPALHVLRLRTDDDDLVVRFGLRTIDTRDQQILLNGQPLKLRGYNRHESHPQFGPALPFSLLVADLQQLRDMGANFIRGSHYPQDQRFLDLCDELGFLVWEEGLGWGQGERQLTDSKFRSTHLAMIEEMVRASFNHPSVIMWGFLNEAASKCDFARPIFELKKPRRCCGVSIHPGRLRMRLCIPRTISITISLISSVTISIPDGTGARMSKIRWR
jgi:beta-glucuronidase